MNGKFRQLTPENKEYGRMGMAISDGSMISSLHIVNSLDRRLGGIVTAPLGVCEALNSAGACAEVLTSRAAGDELEYLTQSYGAVPINYVPRSFPARFWNARALDHWFFANHHKYRIIEIHGIFTLVSLRAARSCRRERRPYLIRSHGALDPFDLRKHAFGKKWIVGPLYVRWLIKHSRGVVCTAEMEAERLVTYGADAPRFVVPLPVAPGQRPSAQEATEFRKKNRIPSDALVVLFMSRLHAKKGLDILIPALAALKREIPSIWFLLVGKGETRFEQVIDLLLLQHDMLPWTTRAGFLSGKGKQCALAASDVFALISRNENFCIAAVEALQAGLPVVISNEIAIYREVEAAGAGVVCRSDEIGARAALRQVLLNPEERSRLSARATTAAATLFSPEAATSRLLDVYQKVLDA
jgi:glycosyltransferase involved in cell wall biosynthesis